MEPLAPRGEVIRGSEAGALEVPLDETRMPVVVLGDFNASCDAGTPESMRAAASLELVVDGGLRLAPGVPVKAMSPEEVAAAAAAGKPGDAGISAHGRA